MRRRSRRRRRSATASAKYTGLHALRHFYASWCINRRVDGGLELPLKVVQARLGHASIQMTADVYGHLFPRGDDGSELAAAERAFLAGSLMSSRRTAVPATVKTTTCQATIKAAAAISPIGGE